ncbi:MAG: polysaccharide biosynthesis tyrosine autokinase [Thermoguttaceae bacterium]
MAEADSLPSKGDSSQPAGKQVIPVVPSRALAGPLRPGMRASYTGDQEDSLHFVLSALRRWWLVATPLGLVFGAAGLIAVYLLFNPIYEAEAWIKIEQKTPVLAFDSKDEEPYKVFVQTQIQLIRSPLVMGPVASELMAGIPELQKQADPVAWLGREVKVSAVGESELFKISFPSHRPDDSARLVNAVTRTYFTLRSQEEASRFDRIVRLLAEETPRRLAEVETLRGQVRELTKGMPTRDRSGIETEPESTAARTLTEIQNQLVLAEVDREVLRAKVAAVEGELTELERAAGDTTQRRASSAAASVAAALAPMPGLLPPGLANEADFQTQQGAQAPLVMPEAVIAGAVEQNAAVQQLKANIAAKRLRLRQIEGDSAHGRNDPAFVRLADEINQDERALEELRGDLRTAARAEMETALAGRRQEELRGLKSQLTALEVKERLLRERHDALLKEVKRFSGDTLEIEFKKAELARAEQVFSLIEDRMLRLRTEQRAPSRVTLLREATVPGAPIQLYPYRNMILAGLAGLLVPFLGAVFWERLHRRVSGAEVLQREAQLAVVGEITRLPVRGRGSPASVSGRVRRSLRMFEESVDSLRTHLVLSEDLQGVQVLAVTSPVKHEGKTSVAAQLAMSLARAHAEATLLIDADLRSPDIHNVFEIPLEPGLAGVLSGEHGLEEAIVRTWSQYVHLLPAGRLQMNPHQLLGNGALEALLGQLRQQYRYVLMDTPPVLPASEAIVLAKTSDACLLCVMRDVSRLDQVKKAYDRLAAAGARIAGAVFNGVPARQYAYLYGEYRHPRD